MPFVPNEGTSLGKHVLVRRLGEGSLGTVWEARKLDTDEHVALKIIEAEPGVLEAVFVRLQRAAKSARRVDHAGMATVRSIEMLETDGVVLLESELLAGCDLATYMRKPEVTLEDTLRLVRHALRPIAAAHKRRDEHDNLLGLAHRDLKPANVFVLDAPTWEGTTRSLLPVKVLDFGLARPEGEPVHIAPKMRGTPAYTPPEVFVGEAHFGATVDVWSMGVILFEILAGERPFHGGPVEMAAKIVATEAPSLAIAAPTVDVGWHEIVDRCLRKDPGERYQDAGELARAMDDVLGVETTQRTEWVQVTLVDEKDELAARDDEEGGPPEIPSVRAAQDSVKPADITTKFETKDADKKAEKNADKKVEAPKFAKPEGKGEGSAKKSGALLYAFLAALIALVAFGLYSKRSHSRAGGEHVSTPPEESADDAGAPPDAATGTRVADNPFIRIPGAVKRRERYFSDYWGDYQTRDVTVSLGLATDNAPATLLGFRPRRQIFAPERAFGIQAHEVTWSELEPFLASHPALTVTRPDFVPADPAARARLPAVNVPWDVATAYCASIQAALPTEEQWEYAARGDARRVHPWGNAAIDPAHTRVYAGVSATEVPVASSTQDVTPEGVHDLAGNAREWTDGIFRDPNREAGDRRASADGTLRPVRGLPVASALPTSLPEISTAFREPVCGVSACAAAAAPALAHIGFRCVRTEAGPADAAAPVDAGPAARDAGR